MKTKKEIQIENRKLKNEIKELTTDQIKSQIHLYLGFIQANIKENLFDDENILKQYNWTMMAMDELKRRKDG